MVVAKKDAISQRREELLFLVLLAGFRLTSPVVCGGAAGCRRAGEGVAVFGG